jgi:uncharacterized membrane protein YeaQ/YmgE (transglycosylase-associated protein family)
MPGDDPGGVIITIIIGVVGAVIGGFVACSLDRVILPASIFAVS